MALMKKSWQTGCHSTNLNIGSVDGIVRFIEMKLIRKLNWLVSALHTNELPLRHLISALDGKTWSSNKPTSPIGKLLDIVTGMEISPFFVVVNLGELLIQLPGDVIRNLTSDQFYAYNIVTAIRSGNLPNDMARLEIGPVSHARWLTTVNRICRTWVSKHQLHESDYEKLKMIAEFIVGVYTPPWFIIKLKSNLIERPRHILFQLKQLQNQRKVASDIVLPLIKRSAWFAFSENVFQTMVSS